MQINGLSSAQAAQSVSSVSRANGVGKPSQANSASTAAPADQLDLSPEAQALSESQATGQTAGPDGIRWERVNALKAAIADGSYDSSARMSGALDNFLDAYA